MKELKLEHLAPYLPYGLKIANKSLKGNIISIYVMEAGNYNDFGIMNVISGINQIPILRPLSDLTKEINHNGETFIPIEKLRELYYPSKELHNGGYMDYVLMFDNPIFYIERTDAHYTGDSFQVYKDETGYELSLQIFNKLFEWHFDVFNLIENNLAIDFNLHPNK